MLKVDYGFGKKESRLNMGKMDRLYTLFIMVAVSLGFLLGQIASNTDHFILPILMLMLYFTFLQISVRERKKAFF